MVIIFKTDASSYPMIIILSTSDYECLHSEVLHLGLALGDVDVVVDVRGQPALDLQGLWADLVTVVLEQLVEDVVGPLHLLLLSDTGLLEQVGHDVTTAKLSA